MKKEFGEVYKKYLNTEDRKNSTLKIVNIDPRLFHKSHTSKNSNIFLNLKDFVLEIVPVLVINSTAFASSPWLLIPAFALFCYQVEKVRKLEISDDEALLLWVIYLNDINPVSGDEVFTDLVNKERAVYSATSISLKEIIGLLNLLADKNILIKIAGLKNKYRVIEQIKMKV